MQASTVFDPARRILLRIALALPLAAITALPGCASLISSATADLADGITSAILNQTDPETVRQGAPAYLLMIDGLIEKSPSNEYLLRSGAGLYSSYASIFVDDPPRARLMTDRAWFYGKQALCKRHRQFCEADEEPLESFLPLLDLMRPSDVPALYIYGATWAGWIEAHQDDWNAVANIPKVEVVMQRVVELDEDYENGNPHLYLGVLAMLLPPSLGGKPEKALAHFERAWALSGQRNLMIRVIMAKKYARPLFDRELHDKWLREVLTATPEHSGFTLMNILAQQQARELEQSADDYF